MLLTLVLLTICFLLVVKGGDLFVDASIDISRLLGIPRIVIGATIVSIATTVPELIVSSTASLMRDSGIAIGNAVGSAIANIGLIVGVAALISKEIKIDIKDFRRRFMWLLGAEALLIFFSWELYMARWAGIVLLTLSLVYLASDYFSEMKRKKVKVDEIPGDIPEGKEGMKKNITQFLIGSVLVMVGSRLLVTSGIDLASALGIPSVIVGLSVIAFGTSLPEFVTAISSAKKGAADLSIGNIVGANVLNIAMITGTAATIYPLSLERFTQLYSMPWMLFFSFLMLGFFWKDGKLGKKGGISLLVFYAIYLAGLVVTAVS